MKFPRIISWLVLIALMFGLLTACDSAPEPVTLDKLPVYSGAKASTNSDYVTIIQAGADQLTKMKDSFEKVESKVFSADVKTKWEDVQKYYEDSLGKDGWKTDPSYAFDDSSVHVKAWTRGKQFAAVVFVSMTGLNDAVVGNLLANIK